MSRMQYCIRHAVISDIGAAVFFARSADCRSQGLSLITAPAPALITNPRWLSRRTASGCGWRRGYGAITTDLFTRAYPSFTSAPPTPLSNRTCGTPTSAKSTSAKSAWRATSSSAESFAFGGRSGLCAVRRGLEVEGGHRQLAALTEVCSSCASPMLMFPKPWTTQCLQCLRSWGALGGALAPIRIKRKGNSGDDLHRTAGPLLR
jgi:hypothetical protein